MIELILDETMSALDSEPELAVQDALKKLKQGRTRFVAAHRLTTIQDADVMHVIGRGVVVESGTYAELLAMREKCYRLWITLLGQTLQSDTAPAILVLTSERIQKKPGLQEECRSGAPVSKV